MPSRKGRRALANNPNNLNKFYPTCLRQEADLPSSRIAHSSKRRLFRLLRLLAINLAGMVR